MCLSKLQIIKILNVAPFNGTHILNTVNIKSMNSLYMGRYTYMKDKYLPLWDITFVAKFFFHLFLGGLLSAYKRYLQETL